MSFSISDELAADLPEFVSQQSAARRWDVSVDTIRRLVSSGKIPAYRLNSRIIRVRLEDVDACFQSVASASSGGKR